MGCSSMKSPFVPLSGFPAASYETIPWLSLTFQRGFSLTLRYILCFKKPRAVRRKNPGKHLVWGKSAFESGLKSGSSQSEQNSLTFPDSQQNSLTFQKKNIFPDLPWCWEPCPIKVRWEIWCRKTYYCVNWIVETKLCPNLWERKKLNNSPDCPQVFSCQREVTVSGSSTPHRVLWLVSVVVTSS